VNRTKHASRRYEGLRPRIEELRLKRKVAIRLYRSIREDSTVAELRRMATLLKIHGRSNMNREDLVQAIHDRTK